MNRQTCAPNLLLVDLLELLREVLTVRAPSIKIKRFAGLGSVTDALVERTEDREVGLLEFGSPVEGATAGGGGACVVHVVHSVCVVVWCELDCVEVGGIGKRTRIGR